MSFLTSFQRVLGVILLYIFNLASRAFRRLRFSGRKVSFEDKVDDFISIFKTTLIFFVFNLLAFFVFTLLPQGRDTILIVIENLSKLNFGSLVSLIVGLLGWCIISEFGARYKIYVTDNSGLSLTDERVNFRKEAQKFVSYIYLLLPVLIVLVSVVIVSFTSIKTWNWQDIWPFTLVVVLLILVFALLSKFYLDTDFIEKLRGKGVWFKVNVQELDWADKLYGIYNDYVFMVRKSTNFKGKDDKDLPDIEIGNTYKRFTDQIEELPDKEEDPRQNIQGFPRVYLKGHELPPEDFEEVSYHPFNFKPSPNPDYVTDKTKPEFIDKINEDGYYRWIYKNNPSFYKTLHKQVHVIAISSVVFLIVISTKFLISYEAIGSPALICLSFGSWLGIYTGLLYIDSRFRRTIRISFRWLLLLWFFIVSYINKDHPVRNNGVAYAVSERPTLDQYFMDWSAKHLADTGKTRLIDSSIPKLDSADTDSLYYPVYFITAEGGALRTGAFTAFLLAKLQDSFPQFKKEIFAFSTVSGGSVGISFFNAIAYLEPNNKKADLNYHQSVTHKFFAQDQLSAPLAKLFYADLLNNFWPEPVQNFDRAIALEKAWEHSYATVFGRPNDRNVFSTNFLSCYKSGDSNKTMPPAWFINTTEVETGLQCYISNVIADKFVMARQRDLLAEKINYGINYSTAVNFSSRFPLFSPSAALYQNDDQIYHYIDGGYVENTGAKTMLEILQSLKPQLKRKHILPYVIQLRFGDTDSARIVQTGFMNEISSVVFGIYNTRAGSSTTSNELLRREVDSLHGRIIEVPLPASSKDIPMSWVFSARSMEKLKKVVDTIMRDPRNSLHQHIPFFRH